MTSKVSLSKRGAIAVVTVDNPPVNALSQAVREGILACLDKAEQDGEVKVIIISCAGKTFIAGADISEFDKPLMKPHLPDVLRRLDQCTKPVVAALFGTVLGGGFELALSCHYRVALKGTNVGMPEVNLGLIPGAGGTQLLPRLVSLAKALELVTSGKPVAVESLEEYQVFDEVVENQLLEATIDFADSLLASGKGPRPTTAISIEKAEDHDKLFSQWRSKVAKKYRGQLAPQYCVDSVENAVFMPFEQGQAEARRLFMECKSSPQSRAMRHAFFAERQCSKRVGLEGMTPGEVKSVAVIGAGTMGCGIAVCFARAGINVRVLELSQENLERGLELIHSQFQKSLKRGRINEQQLVSYMANIQGTCDYNDLADVDLVVEAAFENMEIKKEIFAALSQHCKPQTILASNTSYLDINQIASVTKYPEKVVGMHFFSPASVMKLLEVVKAEATDEQSLVTTVALGKRIGKIPAVVGVCYGFVGNRMYACYGREAQMLLLEGATPEQVDRAMVDWGMAMGPLAVSDLSGIDIGYKARRENPNLPSDPCYFRPADLMVEAGRLGQKNGVGFYRYDGEGGERQSDEQVVEIIRVEATKLGVAMRDTITDKEIQDRLIFALINEGANLLDEGIASRASDIDVIWLNGYGFPRFRGGPMCYAEEIGLEKVLAGIHRFRDQLGERYWKPAPLLERLCSKGKTLGTFKVP